MSGLPVVRTRRMLQGFHPAPLTWRLPITVNWPGCSLQAWPVGHRHGIRGQLQVMARPACCASTSRCGLPAVQEPQKHAPLRACARRSWPTSEPVFVFANGFGHNAKTTWETVSALSASPLDAADDAHRLFSVACLHCRATLVCQHPGPGPTTAGTVAGKP